MSAIIKLLFLCLAGTVLSSCQTQQPANQPNIIFIFADDWGYGDLSAHGNTWVQTPHLDQMAKEGTDFTNFTVNSPVCSPSRVAVMTGQFPARQCIHQHFAAIASNQKRGMPDWMDAEGMSLPKAFQKEGYKTAHFGKWHMGKGSDAPTEDKYGYDEYATFNGSKTVDISAAGSVGVTYAEAFIKKHQDKPFFINLWLHEAHLPHYPLPKFMEKFKGLDEQKQVYASIIAEGDEAVGRIINLLKKLDIDKNTLVVFSTDNGPEWEGSEKIHRQRNPKGLGRYYSVGETAGLKGQKRSLFAGGIRVPFIVRWPDKVPMGKIDHTSVITAVDLLPTFFEAAGIEVPKDYLLDGESALSAFKGADFQRTKPIFWEWQGGESRAYTWPSLGVRDGDWKLVMDVSSEKMELYNLATDWAEEESLAQSRPEKLKELLQMLEEWKQSLPTKPRAHCLSEARKNK